MTHRDDRRDLQVLAKKLFDIRDNSQLFRKYLGSLKNVAADDRKVLEDLKGRLVQFLCQVYEAKMEAVRTLRLEVIGNCETFFMWSLDDLQWAGEVLLNYAFWPEREQYDNEQMARGVFFLDEICAEHIDPRSLTMLEGINSALQKDLNWDNILATLEESAQRIATLGAQELCESVDLDNEQTKPYNRSPRHSPDFRSVRWFGTDYAFTAYQAACVKILWDAWERGTPDVAGETLLERTGSESRKLRDVFKNSRAWKTVIARGETKGSYRLAEPSRRDVSVQKKAAQETSKKTKVATSR
jgi:hypothetical protein